MIRKVVQISLLWLFSFAALSAEGNGHGVLLIEVKVQIVGDLNVTTWDAFNAGANAFRVKNLKTGKTYHAMAETSDMRMMDVPAGIYCLASVTFGGWTTHLHYCGEPFFKVEAGRINNAGRWRFLHHLKDGKGRLFGATEDLDGLLTQAKKRYPEKFQSNP